MSKKIVILSLHLGTGGAERVICNLANLLSQSNEVKIISIYNLNNSPSFYINDKIKIEYLMKNLIPNKKELKDSFKHLNLINIFKEILKSIKILYLKKSLMIDAIKSLDCDVAISTRLLFNGWLAKYANKKIIKIAQEHNHHNNNNKYIKKLVKSLKGFDYFIPVSQELADFYSPILKNTKTIYLPNFIEKMPSTKSNLKNKQIISVGRLDKIKGFDSLIDIFNIFQKKYPDWILHIVGDGSEKQNLQNKIDSLHLNKKITLCGTKLGNELEQEYINSSIYVMTSISESFGLVLIEAASYGLPLFAFDSAHGAKEIIKNNENGFLIPNRDNEQMVKKISEVITNNDKMQALSSNCIITATNFSKEYISEKWNTFLDNI